MAYVTPKTNWAAGNIPVASDLNRIEGNTKANHDAIEAEVVARAADVNSEEVARIAADSTLTSNLASEASARASADRKPYNYHVYRFGSDLTFGELRDMLSPYIPNSGDRICVNGSIHYVRGGLGVLHIASTAYRYSDGHIEIDGLELKLASLEVSTGLLHMASGDTTTIIECVISW